MVTKKLYKLITLSIYFLCLFSWGQFNTLTFPLENKEKKEFPHQTFSSAPKKEDIKEKESLQKKKKSISKSELKKDLDSIKSLLLDFGKKEQNQKLNYKKIEDSLIKVFQNKIITRKEEANQLKNEKIKKFDFISENITQRMAMPLNKMEITSPFGTRYHPIFGGQKMHNGIDLKAYYENVYAVLDGVVSEAGWDKKGGGNYIKVRHSNRFETAYLHLSQVYYKLGEVVKAGYIIGKSGNSGNSTGPHLHFAVKEFGVFVNPTQFLNDLIKVNNLISIQYEQQQLTYR